MRPSLLRSFVLAVALVSLPVSAMAVPLLDPTITEPDVVSGTLDVVYVAGTDTLTISGFALEVDDIGAGPNLQLDAVGSFDLTATVDSSGAMSSGSFTILGTVASEGWNSGTLLTGTLDDFGWDATGALMDFFFTPTGGDLASDYSGQGGIIVATGIITFPEFGSDFNNNFGIEGFGSGTSDTAPLPEPTTGLLFAAALAVATRFGRRAR